MHEHLLTFRALEDSDLKVLHKILNNFDNQLLVGGNIQPMSLNQVTAWLEAKRSDNNIHQFAVDYEGTCCGYVQLAQIDLFNKHAVLGMNILPDYHSKGIGTNALIFLHDFAKNKLLLRKIHLQVRADNYPAIRLYKKVGYKTVGTLENHLITANGYTDLLIMELFL